MSNSQSASALTRRSFLRKASGSVLTLPALASVTSGLCGVAFHQNAAAGTEKVGSLGSGIDLSGLNKPTSFQGALTSLPSNMNRTLHLVNAHTGDDFKLVYFKDGEYVKDSISRLNHLMRDRRANVATNMDTTLYDQLFMLRNLLGINQAIHVLSGYRTPQTNAKLRKRMKRVAKYSLHMEGRAADIYVPGLAVRTLQQAAAELSAGGVGLYSNSHFIHLDTGPVRHWGK